MAKKTLSKKKKTSRPAVMNREHYRLADKLLVAVDCIIFGFDGKQLQALLIKRDFHPEKGKWSLMGGFVQQQESLRDAGKRILRDLTGLSDIFIEQLHAFGNVDRDPAGRVVSVAYYALINIADYTTQLVDTHDAQWFPLQRLPRLIFDHAEMVRKAQERLRQKVANHPIGFELLPSQFTLPQLQSLYEAIYEQPLDKRNFTRNILALGVLKKLNKKEKSSSKKGAFLYVFDKLKYARLHHEGVKFV